MTKESLKTDESKGIIREKQIMKEIRTPYTTGEIEELRMRLVDRFMDLVDLEADRKAEMEESKKKIDYIKDEMDGYVDGIKKECNVENILCDVQYDWDKDLVNYISVETGKNVASQSIPKNTQRDMILDKKEDKKKK